MNLFNQLQYQETLVLAIVAPGIAELVCDSIGLLAAIPAVIAYNKFNNDAKVFSKIENFSKRF